MKFEEFESAAKVAAREVFLEGLTDVAVRRQAHPRIVGHELWIFFVTYRGRRFGSATESEMLRGEAMGLSDDQMVASLRESLRAVMKRKKDALDLAVIH